MEVNSEVTSNDTIRSSLSVRSLFNYALNDFMVVVESAASEEICLYSYLATPYIGEFRRSTIGRSGTYCLQSLGNP